MTMYYVLKIHFNFSTLFKREFKDIKAIPTYCLKEVPIVYILVDDIAIHYHKQLGLKEKMIMINNVINFG